MTPSLVLSLVDCSTFWSIPVVSLRPAQRGGDHHKLKHQTSSVKHQTSSVKHQTSRQRPYQSSQTEGDHDATGQQWLTSPSLYESR